jgi:peptidoglycan L-alanyl-D-glutamate endopeptidase CwlK
MINYEADPVFWQRFLKGNGFYAGSPDGDFGPQSHAAAAAFEAQSLSLAQQMSPFDLRTEGNIQTLQPKAQVKAREFMKAVQDTLGSESVVFKIISGTRTYAEQNALYAQGRTRFPGPIVTRARGGQSNHNFGVAWDIGVFVGGQYVPESDLYKKAGKIGRDLGLEWGGDWKSLQDEPHFQAVPEKELAATRTRFEAGDAIFA